jgi:SAM-dependent methyltransferase
MRSFSNIDHTEVAHGQDRSRRIETAIVEALARGLESLDARRVLELCAGTSDYIGALDAHRYSVIALDRASAMVACGASATHIDRMVGDAVRIPLRANSVDAIVGVFHHLANLAKMLAECRRVANRGVVMQAVVRENLATLWYRRYFPEIDESRLPLLPTLGCVVTTFLRCGFSRVSTAKVFYPGDSGLNFEAARVRPQLLFDAGFRAASSVFRRLDPARVARGLAILERDIASGDFAEVAARFEAEHAEIGDCVVLTAR